MDVGRSPEDTRFQWNFPQNFVDGRNEHSRGPAGCEKGKRMGISRGSRFRSSCK